MNNKWLQFKSKFFRFAGTNIGAACIIIGIILLSAIVCLILDYNDPYPIIVIVALICIAVQILRQNYYSKTRLEKMNLFDDLNVIADVFNKCDSPLFIEYLDPERNIDGVPIKDLLMNKEITSDHFIFISRAVEYQGKELGSDKGTFDFSSFYIRESDDEYFSYEIPLNRVRRISFNDLRDSEMKDNIYNCSWGRGSLSKFLEPVLRQR